MSEWTREIPKSNGYYWAKQRLYAVRKEVYAHASVVSLHLDVAPVAWVIGDDSAYDATDFLWYNDALLFVPPPFTTSDVVRLKVEGYE